MKIIPVFVVFVLLAIAPANAQFAESTIAPGYTATPLCVNCTPEMQATLSKLHASPAAVGGPVGSPTYVMPAAKGSSIIDISPAFADWLQPYVTAIVNALILAAVGWGLTWARTHLNINLDQKQRDALVTALQNQAGSLIADGKVRIESGKIDVHNDHLALAANDLMKSIPDAAKHFGLTPDFVAARIVDTIPQIAAGAQLVAQSAVKSAGSVLP